MLFEYVGALGLLDLCDSVSLKVKQSDNTFLIIDNIVKGTVIEVTDPLAIKYLEVDRKYEARI